MFGQGNNPKETAFVPLPHVLSNGVSFPYFLAQHSSAPSGLSIQHVRFGCGLPR
jgi:hypothetical protein